MDHVSCAARPFVSTLSIPSKAEVKHDMKAAREVGCQTHLPHCQTASRVVVSAATFSLNVRRGAPRSQLCTDAEPDSFGRMICRHRGLPEACGANSLFVEGDLHRR